MTPRPPPLALLHTFEVAARHLSFKKAAAELHLTPAAVSLQIRTLESRLGGPLFNRLTRALELSERGAAMLPQVRAGFECLAEAIRLGKESTGLAQRTVRLVAPPSFATHWLLPRLPRFYAAHADIEVQLSSTSSTVDRDGDMHVLDALRQPAGDSAGTLVVLYGSAGEDSARFAVDKLMTPDYLPVCVPGLGTPTAPLSAPADLLRHVLLQDDTVREPATGAPWGWAQWLAAAGVTPARAPGTRRFSNAVLALEAALAGQGVALASRPLVAAHLASGTLVAPFDRALRSPFSYYVVGNPDDAGRADVQCLRRWLIDEAAASSRHVREAGERAGDA
jgi:LysR family glycine cleavage system transcriptional activator